MPRLHFRRDKQTVDLQRCPTAQTVLGACSLKLMMTQAFRIGPENTHSDKAQALQLSWSALATTKDDMTFKAQLPDADGR